MGIGRLNLGLVSWNLPLTWENPELCSILSPRVSQRNSVPVARGNHLLGNAFISFLLFCCLLLSLSLVLLRMNSQIPCPQWLVWWTCSRLEMTLPSCTSSTMVRTWRVVTAAGDRHSGWVGAQRSWLSPQPPEQSQLFPPRPPVSRPLLAPQHHTPHTCPL